MTRRAREFIAGGFNFCAPARQQLARRQPPRQHAQIENPSRAHLMRNISGEAIKLAGASI